MNINAACADKICIPPPVGILIVLLCRFSYYGVGCSRTPHEGERFESTNSNVRESHTAKERNWDDLFEIKIAATRKLFTP